MLMDENRVLKDNIATLQQQNEQLKASNDQALPQPMASSGENKYVYKTH